MSILPETPQEWDVTNETTFFYLFGCCKSSVSWHSCVIHYGFYLFIMFLLENNADLIVKNLMNRGEVLLTWVELNSSGGK